MPPIPTSVQLALATEKREEKQEKKEKEQLVASHLPHPTPGKGDIGKVEKPEEEIPAVPSEKDTKECTDDIIADFSKLPKQTKAFCLVRPK